MNDSTQHSDDNAVHKAAKSEKTTSKAYTPKKGHATPRRREAQANSGNFQTQFTPQESWGESRKRKKELKNSMSREEWREYKKRENEQRRTRQAEVRRAMDDGDERYLLKRDQGPERRYVRDLVDSRRYLSSWIMLIALLLFVVMMFGTYFPTFATFVSFGAFFVLILFLVEGIMLGRSASKAVRKKFPDTTQGGFAIGFYAYSRATQPRRWRSPRPRVEPGADVS
ncbi:MAG: DUF3043 domain-containing protein [Corynebacterium sp.]|nr:DUF3043 domain-containing protein [Corynebacterium sp.]